MKFSNNIKIGNRFINDSSPAYIIAEIGSNHNGDLNIAIDTISSAKEAGVDAVKFQTFKAESHYSRHTPGFNYLNNVDTFELIKCNELNREWHVILQQNAQALGLDFFSSACDYDAIEELDKLNVPAFKIASFDIPDLDLVYYTALKGKTVILSTGMCSIHDISAALLACQRANNENVILLQCTSLYPSGVHLANLNAIKKLREYFDIIVGYSDHTQDNLCAIAATALGGKVFEKHFTLSRNMTGPDHPFAMDPKMMKRYVEDIRRTESSLGNGIKNGPSAEEKEMFEKGRRSIHLKNALMKGDVIKEENIIIKRPGYGIPPFLKENIIGKSVKVDVPDDHWLSWDMV